ncbi:MAG TPA: 2-amino-4-hydroxy-6-hydroxymethyldihydropteridine diphosphokinase [Bryobacteraceae bacterium]|nr:2-amino-4-hydroxy-6-hydroxymethyldihydropteridine diphosphokinase [Bryobacteraceae bacterium]
MKKVYLALGSNLGDRQSNLQVAVDRLHRPDLLVRQLSSLYESAAVDFVQQPDFLNCVVEAETSLMPMRLLKRVQAIEREMGRRRAIPKGPRNIDIDILLHGHSVMNIAQLQIPHPSMGERRFVLEPLAELAPDLRHPVHRRTIRELLAVAPHQRIVRLAAGLMLPAG